MDAKKIKGRRSVGKRRSSPASAGSAPGGRAVKKNLNRFTVAQKLRAVKVYLEEGIDATTIAGELGCSSTTIYTWAKAYKVHGEEGLKPKTPARRPAKRLAPPITEKIVGLKKLNPAFGVRRISLLLKRAFCLPASHETVRRTLKKADMIEKPKRKPRRNPAKPRFFERSKPNQLWQSDIHTFRLAGKQAYLIGYIDDYSRFIVGLGLYYSQTAQNVLEVYRRAVAQFGLPKEMLTDNGRQYANWRGKTKFQQEMQKDRVHHLRSQPHHPQTLGKIERFWKSIWDEFLCRAQFESFDSARERVARWVSWYNHRRPHQGIGGLCPADRFFEVQHELRKVIESGIQENVLELALRGKPRAPFYMVGRMDRQSVVMEARKGKLVMTVNNGESATEASELVYDLRKEPASNGEGREGYPEHQGTEEGCDTDASAVLGGGEVPGRPGGVDGAAIGLGDLQGAGGELDTPEQLAGQGAGGYGEGARDTAQGQGTEAASAVRAAPEAACEEGPLEGGEAPEGRSAETPQQPGGGSVRCVGGEGDDATIAQEEAAGGTEQGGEGGRTGSPPGGDHLHSPLEPDDGQGRCASAGGIPQDILRMGEPGAGGHDSCPGERDTGPAPQGGRPGEGGAQGPCAGAGGGEPNPAISVAGQGASESLDFRTGAGEGAAEEGAN